MSTESKICDHQPPAACPSTDSERLFAKYLGAGGYDWQFEPEFPGRTRRPDFLVSLENEQLLFEVKELSWREPKKDFTLVIPEKGLREKINATRKKFQEFKDFSCSLVIANLGDWSTPLAPFNVFAAMLGDAGFTFAIGEGDNHHVKNMFLPRGGKMKNQNTTINAIIVLEDARVPNSDYEEALAEVVRRKEAELGRRLSREERADLNWEPPLLGKRIFDHISRVAVFEHPKPRIQLREDIFRGPFDERFQFAGDEIKKMYAGSRVSEMVTETGGYIRQDDSVDYDSLF